MHIPDGYLGPQTYVATYAATVPFWLVASRRLNKTLRSKQVPMLALSSAFCFAIMMFNVPIPGGATGHAVGGVLVSVLLGPWAACIAVSLAVIVQAVIFGDGGITAIGANCLNMAVVMPFVGYIVYRMVSGKSEMSSRRRCVGAAVGGYVGICVAAASAGLMLGLQPVIAHDAAGHALYAPYSLKVAVTAMLAEHMIFFGTVEAVVTGLVVAYIQKTDASLLYHPVERIASGCVSK